MPIFSNYCYLAVSPHPDYTGNYMVIGGAPCFYIKFGDGKFRDSYDTENPSVKGIENKKSKDARETHPDQNGKEIKTKIGKYLEWVYLKHLSVQGPSGETEWHRIQIKPQAMQQGFNIEQLRATLVQLMAQFEQFDWVQGMNPSPSVRAFETTFRVLVANCDWT